MISFIYFVYDLVYFVVLFCLLFCLFLFIILFICCSLFCSCILFINSLIFRLCGYLEYPAQKGVAPIGNSTHVVVCCVHWTLLGINTCNSAVAEKTSPRSLEGNSEFYFMGHALASHTQHI